jgi:hypothetical protein
MRVAQPIFNKPTNIVVKNSFEAIGQFRVRGLVCATIADMCLNYKDSNQITVLGEKHLRNHVQVARAGPWMIFEEKGKKLGQYIGATHGDMTFWFKVPSQYVGEPSSLGFIVHDKIRNAEHSLTFTGSDTIDLRATGSAIIPIRIPARGKACVLAKDDLEKILGRPSNDNFVFNFTAESYSDLLGFYDYSGTHGTDPATHIITASNLTDKSFVNVKVFGKSPVKNSN